MATLTLQQLRNRVLENVGVLASGQEASPEDATRVQEVILASFEELRTKDLARFELTAIPEWAQIPFRDIVSSDISHIYKLSPDRVAELAEMRRAALVRLYEQAAYRWPPYPVLGVYF